MSADLDERYLSWLYRRNEPVRQRKPSRTFWSLFRQLYKKEFLWFVPNDDNRIEDCRDLRREFFRECNIEGDAEWLSLGGSMLEVLVVLSESLSFLEDSPASIWFWHLIEQLDLAKYNDRNYDEHAAVRIDQILDRVIHRTYEPDGRGGLFPLRKPPKDQREVELWYQLNTYLIEQF